MFPTRTLVAAYALAALLALAALAFPLAWGAALGTLLVVTLVAALDVRAALRRELPTVVRELPPRARVDEPLVLGYRVRCAEPTALRLLDELPPDLGGDVELGPVVLAAGETTLHAERTAQRRGARPLGLLHASVPSPLGLFVRRAVLAERAELRVFPADVLRGQRGPESRAVRRELGLRPKRPRGEGSELDSLREYTPDDEPRRIDWRATARARRPVVREYRVERNHTVLVAIDTGRLMSTHIDGQTKLDHALAAALGLVRASSRNEDRVGLIAFDRELRAFVPPDRAARVLGPMLEATVELEPRACDSSYRVLAEVMRTRQKKRALLIVLTDFVEGASATQLEAYLASLRTRHTVLLVGLRDRLLRQLEPPARIESTDAVLERLVLQDLDVERDLALARITRLGVHALDLDPAQITGPLLDRYLQLREAGLA